MLLNQIYASIDCFRFINQIDEKKKMERSWLFKTKQNKIVLEITYFVFWINPTVFLGWQNAKKWFIRYSRFNSVRKSIGCFFPLQQFDLALLDPVISFFLVPFIGLWNSAHFAFLTMNAKFAIFILRARKFLLQLLMGCENAFLSSLLMKLNSCLFDCFVLCQNKFLLINWIHSHDDHFM